MIHKAGYKASYSVAIQHICIEHVPCDRNSSRHRGCSVIGKQKKVPDLKEVALITSCKSTNDVTIVAPILQVRKLMLGN